MLLFACRAKSQHLDRACGHLAQQPADELHGLLVHGSVELEVGKAEAAQQRLRELAAPGVFRCGIRCFGMSRIPSGQAIGEFTRRAWRPGGLLRSPRPRNL
jgi:hypothetical protein